VVPHADATEISIPQSGLAQPPGQTGRGMTEPASAADQHTGTVFASTDVDTKTKEITRFVAPLDQIEDLRNVVVTADGGSAAV